MLIATNRLYFVLLSFGIRLVRNGFRVFLLVDLATLFLMKCDHKWLRSIQDTWKYQG